MKRIISFWLAIVAVLAASCQSDDFFKREIRRLEGLSETRLVKRFGSPDRVFASTVGDMARSPEPWRTPVSQVLSMYQTNAPGNLEVQLKSLSWPHGRILLTVWLHKADGQWVSFYAEEWNMDVVE